MTLNNNEKNSILWWLLIATILVFCLTSCGARKVEKSKTTEQLTVIDTSKTVTQTDTNVKVIDSSQTDEIIIEPIDNTKPSVFNGKTFFNSRITTKKHKNNITTVKSEKVAKIEQKHFTVSDRKDIEVKVSERKSNYWLLLWWLLIPLLVYFAYQIRKYLKENSLL